MTLRSRKKPPTTVQTHTATAPSSYTTSSVSSASLDSNMDFGFATGDFTDGPRNSFSSAAVVAVAFVLISLGLVLPAGAETSASEWSPSRPKQSLASQKVGTAKSPNASENKGWNTASRSSNTSSRLEWNTVPAASKTLPSNSAANKSAKSKVPTLKKPKTKLSQARSQAQMPRRVVATPKVEKSTKPARIPIWEHESTTNRQMVRSPARVVGKEVRTNAMPARLADRLGKAKQSKTPSAIRQVQNTEELRLPIANLPIANLRVADLSSTSIPKIAPRIADGFAAPSPDDVFSSATATELKQPIVRQFQDQTPTQSAANFPDTTTREIQVPSRFEPFGSLPQLDDVSPTETPPQPIQPEENPFEPPNTDPPQVEASQTFELPEPNPEATPDSSQDSLFAPVPDANSNVPANDDDGGDIERIKRQLEELEKLPTLEGEEPDDGDENPLGDDDDESPLFSEDDPEEDGVKGELAGMNGRDFQADAAACRADFEYLKRRQRTDMSLNISPSLTPTEVDMAKAEQTRIEKLSKAPTRTWRDRAGNVIADGNLDDYRNDKVIVRTVNGSVRSIPHHTLGDEDRSFVAAWWELPAECNFEGEQYNMRDFRLTTFTWTAAGTCHKPLYYEQVGVERYGHSSGPIVQPLVSGVHFFGDILMAPYHAGINPPNECQYTLGYYRPGECAPWLMPGFPFTARGFKWEGLAIGAAIALMP